MKCLLLTLLPLKLYVKLNLALQLERVSQHCVAHLGVERECFPANSEGERMTDTGEIITRLRSQHIEIARRAADAIERLVASEAEARNSLNAIQQHYAALEAQLQLDGRPDTHAIAQRATQQHPAR
jgi:hypothetical protein